MNITANNVIEVVIGLAALAGEIPKDINVSEINKRTMQNQISKGKKEMLLKVDKQHNRIRIRKPLGLDYLKEFSADLYEHYMMISNNHHFQRSEKAIENLKNYSDAVLCMIRNGYLIDNINLIHKSNNFGKNEETKDELDLILGSSGMFELGVEHFCSDGEITPLKTATAYIQKDDKRYFTSKYLKRNYSVTHRINLSKVSGIILSNKNLYNLYYYQDEQMIIYPTSEQVMNQLIKQVYENAFGKDAALARDKELPKGSAIIMTKSEEAIPKNAAPFEKTFSEFRVVPNTKNGDFVLKILGCENWKPKLQTALYGEPSKSDVYDGTFDGIPSWEILSCEYDKIRRVKRISQNRPVNFICFKWQEPLVKKLTKNMNATIETLTEEQEDILYEYIKGE